MLGFDSKTQQLVVRTKNRKSTLGAVLADEASWPQFAYPTEGNLLGWIKDEDSVWDILEAANHIIMQASWEARHAEAGDSQTVDDKIAQLLAMPC